MRLLGIDPSLSSTGICILETDSNWSYHESILHDLADPERLEFIYERIKLLIKTYRVSSILYEKQVPQMRYSNSAGSILALAELAGVLKLAFMQSSDVSIYRADPDIIKRYATGKSKAEKSEMIAAVPSRILKRIQKTVMDESVNDAADAYHMARFLKDLYISETKTVTVGDSIHTIDEYYYFRSGGSVNEKC